MLNVKVRTLLMTQITWLHYTQTILRRSDNSNLIVLCPCCAESGSAMIRLETMSAFWSTLCLTICVLEIVCDSKSPNGKTNENIMSQPNLLSNKSSGDRWTIFFYFSSARPFQDPKSLQSEQQVVALELLRAYILHRRESFLVTHLKIFKHSLFSLRLYLYANGIRSSREQEYT